MGGRERRPWRVHIAAIGGLERRDFAGLTASSNSWVGARGRGARPCRAATTSGDRTAVGDAEPHQPACRRVSRRVRPRRSQDRKRRAIGGVNALGGIAGRMVTSTSFGNEIRGRLGGSNAGPPVPAPGTFGLDRRSRLAEPWQHATGLPPRARSRTPTWRIWRRAPARLHWHCPAFHPAADAHRICRMFSRFLAGRVVRCFRGVLDRILRRLLVRSGTLSAV